MAFGGAILGAAGFALIGQLEGAAANAAHEGHQEAVYALSQLHSYDWLTFNAAWAAVLLATGLGARRNGMLPSWLAWATIVLGATQLTPIGFLGSLFIPPWLIVVGIWLFWKSKAAVPTETSRRVGRRRGPRVHLIAPYTRRSPGPRQLLAELEEGGQKFF